MKVICAGVSKTGTKSMALALRTLGYNVHDVAEQWLFHMDEYLGALESNEMPDFATMYADVDAVTDSPANRFFEEIFHAFPSSKVVLMIRDDEEVWLKSLLKSIEFWKSSMSQLWMIVGMLFTPTGRKLKRYLRANAKVDKVTNINSEHDLKEAYRSFYRKHNERVRSVIPAEQLLVYNVKEGWKPLCEFLGVDVPGVPFPRLNVNSEMISDMLGSSLFGKRIFNEVVWFETFMILFLAVLLLLFLS